MKLSVSRAVWFGVPGALALALLLASALSSNASLPASVAGQVRSGITVCQEGPPACDYAAIQDAINAATAGDSIVVRPGVYTERLTLKSGVLVRAQDGPETTMVTALAVPIISAHDVLSATLEGLRIDGRDDPAVSIGVDITNTDLMLSGCILENFLGADGAADQPDGAEAAAIRFGGDGRLTLVGTIIRNVAGGDGLDERGGNGADAVGLKATGRGEVTVRDTTIQHVRGGDADSVANSPYWCDGAGGGAAGIRVSGQIDLLMERSEISHLLAGRPCHGMAAYCVGRRGLFVGIEATGGHLIVRDSLLLDFRSWVGQGDGPSYAIHATQTETTRVERNTITSMRASVGSLVVARPAGAADTSSPCCFPPPGSVVAVANERGRSLQVEGNTIQGLEGIWLGGGALGITAGQTADVIVSGNVVTGLTGGASRRVAGGIDIVEAETARVTANRLEAIRGRDAPTFCYEAAVPGGGATGILLRAVREAHITNNVVQGVAGGPGGQTGPWMNQQDTDGGDASALVASGGSALVQNNTFFRTSGGLAGSSKAFPGTATGVVLSGGANVLVLNNAIVGHGSGISVTMTSVVVADRNAFWDNARDTAGIGPGAGDVHADPSFVDGVSGDMRLDVRSPLIDAGTNAGAPLIDIDGQRRPLDGNGDGVAATDIGAYEFSPGLQGSRKTVDKPVAMLGDVLTYQIAVVNPASAPDLIGVVLTDTLPAEIAYIPDSLQSTSGISRSEDGIIRWQGDVAAGVTITVTFRATIVGPSSQPMKITNEAEVDAGAGVLRRLTASTLANPQRQYCPLIYR